MKTLQTILILFLLSMFVVSMMQLPVFAKDYEVIRYADNTPPGASIKCIGIDWWFIHYYY